MKNKLNLGQRISIVLAIIGLCMVVTGVILYQVENMAIQSQNYTIKRS